MYQLVNKASHDVMFNFQSAAPAATPTVSFQYKGGDNKEILYISLAFVILILLAGLWILYSRYLKDKKQSFGYSM